MLRKQKSSWCMVFRPIQAIDVRCAKLGPHVRRQKKSTGLFSSSSRVGLAGEGQRAGWRGASGSRGRQGAIMVCPFGP